MRVARRAGVTLDEEGMPFTTLYFLATKR